MALDGDKFLITKLDESNYGVWSVKIKRLLIAKSLWQAVNPPPLVALEDQQAAAASALRDAQALNVITQNVGDNMIPLISDCLTALDAWETLEDVYRSTSTAQLIKLKRELTSLRLKDGESITQFLARASSIRTRLQFAGYSVDEDDLVVTILNALPEQYNTVVSIIENMSTIPDLGDLMARLMVVEERNKTNTTNSDTALYTKVNKARRPGGFGNSGGNCRLRHSSAKM